MLVGSTVTRLKHKGFGGSTLPFVESVNHFDSKWENY